MKFNERVSGDFCNNFSVSFALTLKDMATMCVRDWMAELGDTYLDEESDILNKFVAIAKKRSAKEIKNAITRTLYSEGSQAPAYAIGDAYNNSVQIIDDVAEIIGKKLKAVRV